MRIAFDVQGTLVGEYETEVRKLLTLLLTTEHEIIIWSNCFSYAVGFVRTYNLEDKIVPQLKVLREMDDTEEDVANYVDLAIDDDPLSCHTLAAKKVIMVKQLLLSGVLKEIHNAYCI